MEGVNAMRVARPVLLTTEQRDMLESRARARSASARSVERARIVLLAAGGMQDKQIPAKLRIMPEKAARWRNRFWTAGWRPWTKMRHDREDPRQSRRPRSRKWSGKRRKRSPAMPHTGARAAWPKPLNLAKRVCAGSGISMA